MEKNLIEELSHCMTVFEENNPISIEGMSGRSTIHIRWIMPLSVASVKYYSIIVHTMIFFFWSYIFSFKKTHKEISSFNKFI